MQKVIQVDLKPQFAAMGAGTLEPTEVNRLFAVGTWGARIAATEVSPLSPAVTGALPSSVTVRTIGDATELSATFAASSGPAPVAPGDPAFRFSIEDPKAGGLGSATVTLEAFEGTAQPEGWAVRWTEASGTSRIGGYADALPGETLTTIQLDLLPAELPATFEIVAVGKGFDPTGEAGFSFGQSISAFG